MYVYLVASTAIVPEAMYAATGQQWLPENSENMFENHGGALSEFAGRACYDSYGRPNPETASNAGYLDNIRKQGHWSVIEHGTASLAFVGVSRSFTHELIRHRHFSYSQLSQRFCKIQRVPDDDSLPPFVIPPLFAGDGKAYEIMERAWQAAVDAYEALSEHALQMTQGPGVKSVHGANKRAREAARAVLPNMTPTNIVVTGNHVAWRHFLDMRGSEHADAEIRELAIKVYRELVELEPNIYDDYELAEVVIRYNELNRPAETTMVVRRKDIV